MDASGFGKAQKRFTGITITVLRDIELDGGRAFAYKVAGNGYGPVDLPITFDSTRRIIAIPQTLDVDDAGVNKSPKETTLVTLVCDRHFANLPREDAKATQEVKDIQRQAVEKYRRDVAAQLDGVTYLEGEEPAAAPKPAQQQQKQVPAASRV